MKKVLLAVFVVVFCVTSVYAANFAPTKLVLSASKTILYNYDGKALDIPVKVSGVPGLATFMVYTKDMADKIAPTQNGFLGWHFVNKVDTSIYMSAPTQLSVGSNTISWSGKNSDGKAVPAGEYTYYIWAYDNVSPRYMAKYKWTPGPNTQILEKDTNGNPLANPVLKQGYSRWILGTDPMDSTLVENTKVTRAPGWGGPTSYAVQPDDWNYIYVPSHNKDAATSALWKYKWIPNGDAVLESGWGVNGAVVWSCPQFYHINASTDGNYVYVTANTYKEDYVHNELWVVDYKEGDLLKEIDNSAFWGDPDDFAAGGQMNGGPGIQSMRNNFLFLGCHGSCMQEVLDPMRGLENEEDLVVYVNNNGDYVLDHNDEPNALRPWVCNDFNVGPYFYSFFSDAEYFALGPTFDKGAVSFGLLAPDGTGIGYFAFAGETSNQKTGLVICDNGSAFDGLYTSMNEGPPVGAVTSTLPNTYYAAHDVIKGVITNQVSVDEAPAAFAVAQNSPNPFNPTTTISFSIPQAGNVEVAVFNVAGQKVDTIASEFMSAGSHSVTWNAAGFSAGVYFYTVKAGDFSRTMKMTLLK